MAVRYGRGSCGIRGGRASRRRAARLESLEPRIVLTASAVESFMNSYTWWALKSQSGSGTWSALSNNAFWPPRRVFLPLVMRSYAR